VKIAIVDTYYPAFLNSLPVLTGDYDTELRKLLDRGFGTFDAYSFYLKLQGWETLDIVGNFDELQRIWLSEQGLYYASGLLRIALRQLAQFGPDVVFCQDLSYFTLDELALMKSHGWLLAGQCSCRFNDDEKLKLFDVLFTSFPFYVERFAKLGIRSQYLPLAFDPRMLSEASQRKTLDVVFVGGVGKQSHWKQGTETLEAVAAEFPHQFHWFGYGRENLEVGSPLIPCYGGECWGRSLYDCYGRARVVISRHGEIAEGYTNNLRCFEATGMGALLITEFSKNIRELFSADSLATYSSTEELLRVIHHYLDHEEERQQIAANGQRETLERHTYAQRMKTVSEVLQSCLKVAA
jgi:spore maturation protein CgeB